jgi:hypothetical protein
MKIVPAADLLPWNRRRSKRVKRRVPIIVRLLNANKSSTAETTHTVIVNDHGALILLAAAVKPQQIIRIENLNAADEVLCRVTNLGPSFMGKTQVAVEFILPMPGFWNTIRNPETLKLGQT